ncbi:unnamed protein product [Urochloa decumbens]|uniref:Uncharacterized protein n=1 Tax=Urochloa decumbens TaxID=240449 RepID=A0ABC9F7C1_9POAL
MHPRRNGHGHRRGRGRGGAADAGGFVVPWFAAVFAAVSFLLAVIVGAGENGAGGSGGAAAVFSPVTQWQVILGFAVMSAGLLQIMNGMRLRDARHPVFVRRVVDAAAAAVLWNGGGPERLLPVLIVLVCSVLQAWFDFF